jgi:Lrp/AsnC family transcriptional regulator, leucine-responsive regulatory protein
VETPRLDETDFRILRLLLQDGRASFARLGDAVGLSPHGAADRVRRLVRVGVVKGFTIALDAGRAGRALDAYIDVRLLPKAEEDAFEKAIRSLPAAREYAFVTGRFDYEVRVACVDTEDLDATVRAIRRSGGVANTETRIVMRSWTSTELEMPALDAPSTASR